MKGDQRALQLIATSLGSREGRDVARRPPAAAWGARLIERRESRLLKCEGGGQHRRVVEMPADQHHADW